MAVSEASTATMEIMDLVSIGWFLLLR
jgi:hypothetical protein